MDESVRFQAQRDVLEPITLEEQTGSRTWMPLPTLDGEFETDRFETLLARYGEKRIQRNAITTLQVNVGKLCNQACHHCHVDAGPKRKEIMTRETAEQVIVLLENSPAVDTLDITGGAPELNANFERMVKRASSLGKKAVVRCNLTVLFERGMERLPEVYQDNQVEIVASLPCYLPENVNKQRGLGVFEKSVEALQLLNGLGYGMTGCPLQLHLVYNPLGAHLPPPQKELEEAYRKELRGRFGIQFNQLFTITNMPIKRFAGQLAREGKMEFYMSLLSNHFNPETLPYLMCRYLVSVSWDGKLYDCDFNQMLELPVMDPNRPDSFEAPTVWDIASFDELEGRLVRTADHCLGCTAGSGSSCGGALASTDNRQEDRRGLPKE